MLVLHQNLVDVVRMCWAASEMVFKNLKDMTKATRIVNVDVRHALVTFHKEGELKVSEVVVGFEAISGCEPNERRRQVV